MTSSEQDQTGEPVVLPGPRKPGTFLPGRSGNPAGRPSLPEWFGKAAEEALRTVAQVATGELDDDKVSRAQAAVWMAERHYGKAKPQPEETAEVDSPVLRLLLEVISRKGGA